MSTAPTLPDSGRTTSFLDTFLDPIRFLLEDPEVSEISLNHPGEVWVERRGQLGMERHGTPKLTRERVEKIAEQVALLTDQRVCRTNPLLSASLQTGERIQCVLPPASPQGAFSIRKQVLVDLDLGDYARTGAFADCDTSERITEDAADEGLRTQLDSGDIQGFLTRAVAQRKNLILSGGTSTGKTTFMNALIKAIPPYERLITIEDTNELRVPHANWLALRNSKGGQGDAEVSMIQLLEASLRLRPDRILMGELRGEEAYTYLRAVNTGHPGSISTVHADSPRGALNQLVLMVLQAQTSLSKPEILDYLAGIIDVIIQLARTDRGERIVSCIYFPRKQALA